MRSFNANICYPGMRTGVATTGSSYTLDTTDADKIIFHLSPKKSSPLKYFWFNIRQWNGSKSLIAITAELFELSGLAPTGSSIDSVDLSAGSFSILGGTSGTQYPQYYKITFAGNVALDPAKLYGVVLTQKGTSSNYLTIQNAGPGFPAELGWSAGSHASTDGGLTWPGYSNGAMGYLHEHVDGTWHGEPCHDGYYFSNGSERGFELDSPDVGINVIGCSMHLSVATTSAFLKLYINGALVAQSLEARGASSCAVFAFENAVPVPPLSRIIMTFTCSVSYTVVDSLNTNIGHQIPKDRLLGSFLNSCRLHITGGVKTYLSGNTIPNGSLILDPSKPFFNELSRRKFFSMR